MRWLLAPLTRWLDRRIDARVFVATQNIRLSLEVAHGELSRLRAPGPHAWDIQPPNPVGSPLPTGHVVLFDMARDGIRDASVVRVLREALSNHDASSIPSSQAEEAKRSLRGRPISLGGWSLLSSPHAAQAVEGLNSPRLGHVQSLPCLLRLLRLVPLLGRYLQGFAK